MIPGYSDFTFVLHDSVLGDRKGRVESRGVLGRGKFNKLNGLGLYLSGPEDPRSRT